MSAHIKILMQFKENCPLAIKIMKQINSVTPMSRVSAPRSLKSTTGICNATVISATFHNTITVITLLQKVQLQNKSYKMISVWTQKGKRINFLIIPNLIWTIGTYKKQKHDRSIIKCYWKTLYLEVQFFLYEGWKWIRSLDEELSNAVW